jgi:hypothetical protein
MGISVAVFIALVLHAALFGLVRPAVEAKPRAMSMVPITHFMGRSSDGMAVAGIDPRLVSSPVLFSLPSAMGFSRELKEQDVKTRLTFSQAVKSEQFLRAQMMQDVGHFDSLELMLSTSVSDEPALPSDLYIEEEKRFSSRRVTLAPELKNRMVGGVVLPPELNHEVAKPWEVRAEINVSELGQVRHVFLDRPLESPQLNLQVLRLLHGLKFNPGEPVYGIVEIYSPELKQTEETEP